jgi:hypothetical protein
MQLAEQGSEDAIDSDHDFDTRVCLSFMKHWHKLTLGLRELMQIYDMRRFPFHLDLAHLVKKGWNCLNLVSNY